MLSQHEAMVSAHNQHGILPHIVLIPHDPFPGIPFLHTESLIGTVPDMVGGPAVFEVMVMIRYQMGMHAAIPQKLRHGVVKGLQLR